MFYAAKFLSFITQPLAWVMVLLTLGLLCLPRRRKIGLALSWAALAILVLVGWQPLPDALLRQLEAQYPAPAANANLQRYAGMVVLGGALEPAYVMQGNGQVAFNGAAERMTVPVALMRQNPHLHLLFTGGESELFEQGLTEADRAKIFFDSMGVPAQRVVYESAARTTYENAIFSAKLPGVDASQPWLLVTSAWHMPRAMAAFQKAGWNVTPCPADFRTGTHTPWTQYSLSEGARKWKLALHELAGMWAYRLAGRL